MCIRKRSDRQPSMKTCERHSCAVDRCDLPAQSHSTFCRRHGCEADNCTQYKEAQSWYCNQHECQRVRCPSKAALGADYCVRHLEEEEQDKKAAKKKDKHKNKDRHERDSNRDRECRRDDSGHRRRERSLDRPLPALVIVHDHGGGRSSRPSSPYWREESPVRCRGRLLDPDPDCVDDAHVGRARRGYYDRVGGRRGRYRWDD